MHQNDKNESRYAENDYFEKAVCLNERGKVQAKAIGEHINNIGLPIGYVASSVSCRSRQTADLAFGGYNSLHRILVHSGPYNENYDVRTQLLIEFYKSLKIENGKNPVSVLHPRSAQESRFQARYLPFCHGMAAPNMVHIIPKNIV